MQYKTKPIVVDAIQWFKLGDHPDVTPSAGIKRNGWLMVDSEYRLGREIYPGDWIITKPNGEIIVMNDADFHIAYQPMQFDVKVMGVGEEF